MLSQKMVKVEIGIVVNVVVHVYVENTCMLLLCPFHSLRMCRITSEQKLQNLLLYRNSCQVLFYFIFHFSFFHDNVIEIRYTAYRIAL